MKTMLSLWILLYVATGAHGYGADLEDTGLAIAYQGILKSSYTCQNQQVDLGTYNQSYIIAGAPLRTYNTLYGTYGDTWEKNSVHFGLFHASTEGAFVTNDNIYGLQFSTAAWPVDESGLYDTSKPGERLLDLGADGSQLQSTMVDGKQGYTISGDQDSVDTSATQPNSVGLYLVSRPGLPDACGGYGVIFNWTQSTQFEYSLGFSNTTAWFSLRTDIGNGTALMMSLNASRVNDDSVVRYGDIALNASNPTMPMFVDSNSSSLDRPSTMTAAPAATSSSAATRSSGDMLGGGIVVVVVWGGFFAGGAFLF